MSPPALLFFSAFPTALLFCLFRFIILSWQVLGQKGISRDLLAGVRRPFIATAVLVVFFSFGLPAAVLMAHGPGQEIEIAVDVGVGRGSGIVWTCDLTHGYIDINADYRS